MKLIGKYLNVEQDIRYRFQLFYLKLDRHGDKVDSSEAIFSVD